MTSLRSAGRELTAPPRSADWPPPAALAEPSRLFEIFGGTLKASAWPITGADRAPAFRHGGVLVGDDGEKRGINNAVGTTGGRAKTRIPPEQYCPDISVESAGDAFREGQDRGVDSEWRPMGMPKTAGACFNSGCSSTPRSA